MKTVRFTSVCQPALLPPDENKDAGGQRKDPHQDSGKDDAKEDPDADQD